MCGVGLIDHGRRRIIELRIGPVLALSRPGRSNRGARTEAQTREDVSKVAVTLVLWIANQCILTVYARM